MSRLNLAVTIAAGSLCLLVPGLADAHFMLVAPPTWWTQLSDGTPQKGPPCGNEAAGGTAATHTVTVYQPGQPVSVTVMATIAHPGWWRISLREGASATQNATLLPDPAVLGTVANGLQCTPAFINNPVWSPTQPVLADKLGIPAAMPNATDTLQSGTKTFQVTIPANAHCSSASPCTLQVLMIMTDHPVNSCNYHHCADLAAAGAGTGGTTGAGTGGTTGAGTGGMTGVGGATTSGQGGAGVGGTTGAAGHIGTGGAGALSDAGASTGGGTGGATGTTGTGGASTPGTGLAGADSGCSCATSRPAASWGAVAIALATAIALRRRRRTR